MNSSNAEVQSIRLVADSWTAAVHTGNIEQLGELMTDDIVVIHRNGRTVSEKSAVMEDFAHSLRTFSIQQTVESEEIIVAGEWAFDRANVHTAICSREGGDAKHFDSNSVTILRKESGGWCVARANWRDRSTALTAWPTRGWSGPLKSSAAQLQTVRQAERGVYTGRVGASRDPVPSI